LLSFSHFFLWDILKVIKTLATLNHPFQQAKETTAYVHVMLINIYDKKNCIFQAFLQYFGSLQHLHCTKQKHNCYFI